MRGRPKKSILHLRLSWAPRVPAVLALLVALVACATPAAEVVRKVTYPSSFQYVKEIDVKNAMWRLAIQVRDLDALLRGPRPADVAAQRAEIRAILERMRTIVRALDPAPHRTNHPQIDAHVAALVRDLDAAVDATSGEPPDFYLAGAITGSCVYCHQ